MASRQPTPIDMATLKKEILGSDPVHALPHSMSDLWLKALSASLERIFEGNSDQAQQYLAAPLALILHLLRGKSGSENLELTDDVFLQYLNYYRVEVELELLSRTSSISITPATLVTIFTDRDVTA